MRPIWKIAGLLLIATTLAACAQQPPPNFGNESPGFFYGMFHGATAPFAMIFHALGAEGRIYAFPNSGGWYDFGFIVGCLCVFGGGASQA